MENCDANRVAFACPPAKEEAERVGSDSDGRDGDFMVAVAGWLLFEEIYRI